MADALRKRVVGCNPTAVEQWIQGVGREGGSLGGLPIGGHLGLQPERQGEVCQTDMGRGWVLVEREMAFQEAEEQVQRQEWTLFRHLGP